MSEMLWNYVSKQIQWWTLRFCCEIWSFTLKKLKLITDPHVGGSLRQILKNQTEVENNSCWLEFHFSMIICIGISTGVPLPLFFWPTKPYTQDLTKFWSLFLFQKYVGISENFETRVQLIRCGTLFGKNILSLGSG